VDPKHCMKYVSALAIIQNLKSCERRASYDVCGRLGKRGPWMAGTSRICMPSLNFIAPSVSEVTGLTRTDGQS